MTKSKPKYLYVQNFPFPSEKAHGVYIAKTIEAMSKLDWETHLLTPKRKFNQVQQQKASDYYEISAPVNYHVSNYSGILAKSHAFSTIWFYLSNLKTILEICPAVIQTTDPEGVCLISLLKCFGFKCKLIYDVHIDQPKWINKWVLKQVDKLIDNCIYYQQEFLTRGIDTNKILVLPNGFDKELFESTAVDSKLKVDLGIKDTDFVVGYIGMFETLGEEKGIKALLMVCQKIKDTIPIKILLVGGPESLMIEYRELAAKLNIRDMVIFHKLVPPTKVPKYMKLCHLGWIVYPDTLRFRDRISPMKAIEYAAAKIAIIASNLPSIKTIFQDDAVFYIKPDNIEEAVEKIKYIYSHPNDVIKKIECSYQKIQSFTWEKRQQSILNKLDSLL